MKCAVSNAKTKNIIKRFRLELVIAIKNDAKHRFFNNVRLVKDIENELSSILNVEDNILVHNVTEKVRESMFVRSKEKLVDKFCKLKNEKQRVTTKHTSKYVKEPILNLASDEIPEHHRELLTLGPKFVPHAKCIPYMDIVSTTESSALKLEYGKRISEAQNLRRDVLHILKLAKPVKDNLNQRQRLALKEQWHGKI